MPPTGRGAPDAPRLKVRGRRWAALRDSAAHESAYGMVLLPIFDSIPSTPVVV
jgi:hypothetical protein